MKQKFVCFFILLLVISGSLASQSNDVVDRFMKEEKAGTEVTAYLVLLSVGLIAEEADPAEALDYIGAQPWGSRILGSDVISFGRFAMLTLEVLDIPGGLFYSLFPSPRYAAREFVYLKFIPGRKDPTWVLTPFEVITGLSAALQWKESEL